MCHVSVSNIRSANVRGVTVNSHMGRAFLQREPYLLYLDAAKPPCLKLFGHEPAISLDIRSKLGPFLRQRYVCAGDKPRCGCGCR